MMVGMRANGPPPRPRRNTPHVSLKACREAQRLTQTQVAATLGIDPTLLGHYETGARDIPARLLADFARAYGVRPDAIVWGAPTPCDEEDDLSQEAS